MKRLILCVLTILLLPGCVGWPSPQSGATVLGDLTLILWVSHQSVNVGQPVTIRFTVRNDGKERTTVYERNGKPVMDIIAGTSPVREGDPPRPRWSDGKALTPELTRLELKPGEARVIEMIWTPSQRDYQYDRRIAGRVWYCDGPDLCYNEVGLGVTVGFVYSPFP